MLALLRLRRIIRSLGGSRPTAAASTGEVARVSWVRVARMERRCRVGPRPYWTGDVQVQRRPVVYRRRWNRRVGWWESWRKCVCCVGRWVVTRNHFYWLSIVHVAAVRGDGRRGACGVGLLWLSWLCGSWRVKFFISFYGGLFWEGLPLFFVEKFKL